MQTKFNPIMSRNGSTLRVKSGMNYIPQDITTANIAVVSPISNFAAGGNSAIVNKRDQHPNELKMILAVGILFLIYLHWK